MSADKRMKRIQREADDRLSCSRETERGDVFSLVAPSFKLSSLENWLKFISMASQYFYKLYLSLLEFPFLANNKVSTEGVLLILLPLRGSLGKRHWSLHFSQGHNEVHA